MADGIVADVEYRTLAEFPGYRFGSDGTVWSCFTHGYRRAIGPKWNPRKTKVNPRTGYMEVILTTWVRGFKERRTCRVHLLIAEVFHGPCPDGLEACHDNGNRTDNRSDNLRWDTRKNNHADKHRHGTMMCGESHVCAKLTAEQVRTIREMHAAGRGGYRTIGQQFGLRPTHVRDIVKRRSWKSVA